MKAAEVHKMTDAEIAEELPRLRQRLFELRSQAVTEKLENPTVLGKTRRDIARLMTERRRRDLDAATPPGDCLMSQAPPPTAETPSDSAGRRRAVARQGVVTSDKRQRTRTVEVDFQSRHPKYGKYITRQVKYHVHDQDNVSKNGDLVEISPCRPLSKTKSWRLVRVIEAAPEPVTHKVAEDTAVEEQVETAEYHPGEQAEDETPEQP